MTAKVSKRKYRTPLILLGCIVAIEIILLLVFLVQGNTIALFEPAGTVARQQRNLIVFAGFLSLFVIVPVFVLLAWILWRFRDGNHTAQYRPNWDGSAKLEALWWGLPMVLIIILAVVTFKTSHSLDPYQALESQVKPVTIQVVALEWKWLFIYPEQNIATVNYLKIPENTPINFEITSDAPMNSFWIPQLGGQVYAMSGMQTKLHLMADNVGSYRGQSANISGEGFSGMKFSVESVSKTDFTDWVTTVWESPDELTTTRYAALSKPTKDDPVLLFGSRDQSLYRSILTKYNGSHGTNNHSGMPSHTGSSQ